MILKNFYCLVVGLLLGLGGVLPTLAQNLPPQTIVYSSMANVGPLNPHLYSPNQMFAQEMVYEPLVRLGERGEIEPALAQRWEVSEGGLRYTFYLRPGVKFSDGTAFNAQAVVKNFQAIMANKNRHSWLPIMERIKDYQALDELIFVLTLNAPYYPVLEDLSLPRPFRFLSPSAFGEDGFTHNGIRKPVGTGPWQLVETRLGEYDRFDRNALYWGEPAKAAHVLVKVVPDPISRAIALNTGEVDLIYGIGQITYNAFNALRKNPAFVTETSQPMGGMALAINSNRAPTNELAVRQALQYATNKAPIIQGVFLGSQQQADTLFSPQVPYCDVGLKAYAFDQERARALLEGAGWVLPEGKYVRERNGQSLEIIFYYVGNNAAEKAIAEILQAQYAQVGIRLVITGEEMDSFLRRQKDGDFGIIVNTTWGPPFEPHAMVGSMRQASHADYQAQRGLPMKAQIDAMIGEVLQTQDVEKRKALYREILTTLHEQAVYLPIFYNSLLQAHKAGVLENVHFGAGQTQIPFADIVKKVQ